MSFAPPASRNAPCPCGSGRRYKECHGALGASAPAVDPLAEAARAFDARDYATMERLCAEVLHTTPRHPVALELLARRASEDGEALRALDLLLDAVQAMATQPLPPAVAYRLWSALNSAFVDAVAGQDAATAEARRSDYRAWQQARAPAAAMSRAVTVVLVLSPSTTAAMATHTLASLAALAERPAELLVAVAGSSPAEALVRARLELLPFDASLLPAPLPTVAEALNQAVERARLPWLVVVEPPHAFTPDHLTSLLDILAASGAAWAFSDSTIEPLGEPPADALAAARAAHDAARTSIAKADALGFTFIAQAFAPIGSGAVLFARELPARVGGFRPLPGHELWDFCLRALWEEEPAHVAAQGYRHTIAAGAPAWSQVEREAAQLRMFRDYYARACRDDATPANVHAPALARWGLAFLRRLFQAGHVLMVDLATLQRLHARVAATVSAAVPQSLTPGINLLGFAFGEFGLGENLRALARACVAGDVPFVVKDIEQHLATRQADRSVERFVSDDLRHRLSLMCVNPDMLKAVRPLLERTRVGGGRCVGYWYWELATTPRNWEPAYEAVDEIWCATEFVAEAIRRATDKPVIKIPPPIEVALERDWGRAYFGLPQRPCLFLFTFDYNSFVKRKNPEAVVAAFRAAFPRGRDDVGLVVKSVNGARRPERVETMRALIGDDPRIVHLDRFLGRDESYGLIAATDVYVSLHRAEGLGLGLAEAMALGKPTVATAYSGNLEFMHEGNSLLVGHRLVPIAPGEYLVDDERFVWADPDIEAAARHLRVLADDPDLRARLGAAGQRDIRAGFNRERVAGLLRRRLAELGMLDERAARQDSASGRVPSTTASFLSYAQNGEDALLAHVLSDVGPGFYVDVGANDPDVHSVTKAFYERGWRGINVEPVAEWHARLVAARPRDVNLAVAVARERGEVTLHEFAGSGLSTLDAGIAALHAEGGRAMHDRSVPALPLAEILATHAPGEVHFLKIDVEGAEGDVLAGADFVRHRPWIVVVEATRPLTAIASYDTWEPQLIAAGYRFAHDDGLNRYYVSEEHADLAVRFAPAERQAFVRAAEMAVARDDLPAEQRFDARAQPFLDTQAPEPTLAQPTSQLCTVAQFREDAYRDLCRTVREPPMLRRKQWEHIWILRCLDLAGMLAPGRRGLGFGCGREPLAAAIAARGCAVVATDLAAETAAGQGWIETGQHARGRDDLNVRGLCDPAAFSERVAFRAVDMNAIPADLGGFDFVWSSCAFEHLGSLDRGLAFVLAAMRCVRPGGLALHTTEFNLSSNGSTIETPSLAVYRRQDIERLRETLARAGHRMWPLNLQPGRDAVDRFVDVPPYRDEPHLKLKLGRFTVTSIGIAIERGAAT